VALSQDGRQVVSGGYDRKVRLWTIDAPGQPTELGAHDGWVRSVAFSPDGRQVVSGSDDGKLRLWTIDAPARATELGAHKGSGDSVAFSPDGRQVVSGCDDGKLWLWDVGRRDRIAMVELPARITCVAIPPAGQPIVRAAEIAAWKEYWRQRNPTDRRSVPQPIALEDWLDKWKGKPFPLAVGDARGEVHFFRVHPEGIRSLA
jgi:dipeptidyl aminopeptidase/acylaminoacyl peptidase